MRTVLIALMIATGALASPAFAQPQAADKAAPAQPQVAAKDQSDAAAPTRDAQADAALAMSIRMRAEAELRIARYACAAGDAAKCAVVQSAKAPTTPSTPVP